MTVYDGVASGHLDWHQGGIFPGKMGRLFPGNVEISQEIFGENHALFTLMLLSLYHNNSHTTLVEKHQHLMIFNEITHIV
jgi:hypothetical protein